MTVIPIDAGASVTGLQLWDGLIKQSGTLPIHTTNNDWAS